MTGVIVVGSGVAGLATALHLARGGADVQLVTKAGMADGSTRHAQGGIAAALFPDDSVESHAADTLAAGAGLCDPAAVDVLVSEGPARVRELMDLGVAFDRDASGALARGLEAAHAHPRILHAGGDATGLAIEIALIAAALEAGVRLRERTLLADLLVEDGRVAGVELLADGRREVLRADAVVLATGGAGRLWARTTNPDVVTGDGIAAALRAGAAVVDLEFAQFHPTVLAEGTPFLVSEAVRGEGADLIDLDGRRFVLDDHPDGELAPRDVVARSISRRMAEQGGRPVLLDATRIGRRRLEARFPTIARALAARGLDWAAHPIPVAPAAHYLMGGIATDLDGRTSLAGLLAVGECARTGVHGANRLASNSLLEGAVFAARAATAILAGDVDAAPALPSAPSPESPSELAAVPPFSRAALQRLMWDHVGLLRDGAGLAHAVAVLAAWQDALPRPQTVAAHEDAGLVRVGLAAASAALARPGSVGSHFRTDDASAHARELLSAGAAC
ncbi:L-aspartate oxidase [Microbacterium sp. JZ101]